MSEEGANRDSRTCETGWQPIETAPRDGTMFLATVHVHVGGKPSHWDMHVIWTDDETGDVHSDAYQGWQLDDYSHWMHLPTPPKEAA